MNLAPLREVLLAEARADAERELAEAEDAAAERLARAYEEASAMLAQARADGELAAEVEAAHVQAEARRHARALVLVARRALWDELVAETHARAVVLRDSPAFRSALEAAARAQLGADARVETLPDGGVLARTSGCSVDYSLTAVVDRAVAANAARAEELWS